MVDGPIIFGKMDEFVFKVDRMRDIMNRPKVVRWVTKELPKSKWHRCPTCNGDGWYESAGDLHRSAGIVPCTHCDHGTVKRVSRPVYRVKAGSNKT